MDLLKKAHLKHLISTKHSLVASLGSIAANTEQCVFLSSLKASFTTSDLFHKKQHINILYPEKLKVSQI